MKKQKKNNLIELNHIDYQNHHKNQVCENFEFQESIIDNLQDSINNYLDKRSGSEVHSNR